MRNHGKIDNLMQLHKRLHGRGMRPTHNSQHETMRVARAKGMRFDDYGRFIAPRRFGINGMEIGTPAGYRWERGKLVPRHHQSLRR